MPAIESGSIRRKILVIGIGAGHPDYLTLQAVKAIGRANVFFIPEKGDEKEELARLRYDMIAEHAAPASRTVTYAVPNRRSARNAQDDYGGAVGDWHAALADIFARLVSEDVLEGEVGAFLVWGDPALYDSALRILDRVKDRGDVDVDIEVIPGISAMQALAARHGVALNAVGKPFQITNGRDLADGMPEAVDSLVVLLNADKALRSVDPDLQVYWGGNLGLDDEQIVSGRLGDVVEQIEQTRSGQRQAKGWVMDTVLFKRR